jgi:hypothetical protein
MREKLASVQIGDGREAAIWREEDGTTGWTAETHGWALTGPYTPVVLPVPDGTLVAGEMPPGAETVEVHAPVEPRDLVAAGGHYVAVVPIETWPDAISVVARDGTGSIVEPPLPEPPRLGRFQEPEEPDEPLPEEATLSDLVRAAPFASYGLAQAKTESFGYGWGEDGIHRAQLFYDDRGIEVTSDMQAGPDAKWRARIAIANAIRRDIHSGELIREALGRVDRAGADEIEIDVEGRPTVFCRFTDGTTEAAAAVLDGVTVLLVSRARTLEGLRLERL